MANTATLEESLTIEGEWKGTPPEIHTEDFDPRFDSGRFTGRIMFELGPNGNFIGTTQDKHGSATIEGTLVGDHLKFTKKYHENNPNQDKVMESIYEGERTTGDRFRGTWCPSHAYGKAKEWYGYLTAFSLEFKKPTK